MKRVKKGILGLALGTVLVGGVFSLNRSKALEQVELTDKRLALYIKQDDGSYTQATTIPSTGYTLNENLSVCSNGAIPKWKNKTLNLTNLTTGDTSCYLYFDKKDAKPIVSTILSSNELVNENGYRYEGLNPNNYVTFNDETWRIIGVFNTTKSDGNTEQLVKIIRDESIGNISWDSGGTYGENNWETSDIKTILNGQYLNGENINYSYRNQNNEFISDKNVTITGKSLKAEAREMVENVVWNLGGAASTNQITTEAMYTAERGTEVYGSNPTTWVGKVGLMYASDYGYASPASTCARTTTLFDLSGNSYRLTGCKDNNWLYKGGKSQWTMTPRTFNAFAFFVNYTGDVNSSSVFYGYGSNPSVYLKSSVKIIDGDGSNSNPYILEGAE